jgi:predicted phage terminase large subunit-like protein
MRTGDYGCTVVAGRGTARELFGARERARKYILEDFTERCSIERHLRRIVDLARKYSADEVVIESNNFQRMAGRDLRELLGAEGVPCPVKFDDVHAKKITRMLSIEPEIARGEVWFSSSLSRVYRSQWDGLRRDESHAHDDAPDATEKVIRALRSERATAGTGAGKSGAWIGPRRREWAQ